MDSKFSSLTLSMVFAGCIGNVVPDMPQQIDASTDPGYSDEENEVRDAPRADAGAPGADASGSSEDASARTDAAAPRTDSGTPRADGGTGASDSGTPRDAGVRDAGPVDPPITKTPSPCPAANAPFGTWEDITPPGANLSEPEFGINNFVVNPQDSAIITVGTSKQGIWRSTDCGAHWEHINTGRNGAILDSGRQWSMVIDPQEPNTIYTVSGHGAANSGGLWKTTNGGRDWDQILSKEVMSAFESGAVSYVVMDPTRSQHLLVAPHFACVGSHGPTCLAESSDGGKTWTVRDGTPSAGEGFGLVMESQDTWYWMKGFGGMYRTTNAGGSWSLVGQEQGYSYNAFYKAPDGARYVPAAFSIITSKDGVKWNNLANSPGAQMLTGTATTIWASAGSCVGPFDKPIEPISYASVTNPTSWTTLAGPKLSYGAQQISYDPDHKLLYVSACRSGLWRIHTDK